MPDNLYGYNKKCRRCRQNKHASNFPRQKTEPGQMPLCKDCKAELKSLREEVEGPDK